MRRRRKPVQRDEVLLADRCPMTMPLGTYRVEHYATERFVGKRCVPYTLTKFVGVPALWRSLIDELAAEAAAEEEETARTHARLMNGTRDERRLAAILARREPLQIPVVPEFRTAWRDGVGEYECDHCGIRFLGGWYDNRKRVRCCSNRCAAEHNKAMQRRWHEQHPATSAKANASRTQKRAAARADRVCEHCGVTIEAARSTRRYCSDICRVRAHHQRHRQVADG